MVDGAAYDTAVPVLVLKIGRYVYHAGGLGIVRSLGRLGISIYGVHEDRLTPAALSRYLCGRYIWPTSPADLSGLVDGVAAIGRHLKRPAILIPTDDVSAILIAENASALDPWFRFPHQAPTLPRTLANKAKLYQLCVKLGVPCPVAYSPQSLDELRPFLDRAALPIVVKRTRPWLAGSKGLRTTEVVRTPDRLWEIYGRSAAPYADLMLQEYIPDDCAEDWIFHGYADASGDCLVCFTGVKRRSYPAHAGITTFGCSVENGRLCGEARSLMRALSYRGIMDLDYRFDRRDNRYKLLDFNPRIGAQFRLFEDERGIDVVRALHLDMTGRTVPRAARTPTRRFMVENFDLLASACYVAAGELTLSQWAQSVRAVDEAAFFSHDDPLPFLAMLVRFFAHGVLRVVGIRRENRIKAGPRFVPGRGCRIAPDRKEGDRNMRVRAKIKRIYHALRRIKASGPLILEYHRVADAQSDPWALCVAPRRFAEQLETMRRHRTIMPLRKLVRDARERGLPDDAMAITFDDGYCDVLHNAAPLLERFDAPATVFVATGYIGGREFWWDELERMLLFGKMPGRSIRLESLGREFDCGSEETAGSRENPGWRGWQKPPTRRHAAYLEIWRHLRRRPASEQRRVLDELRLMIGHDSPESGERPRCLTWDEATTLASCRLIEIGAHSVTHPSLSAQPRAVQENEIVESKKACEGFVGESVTSFAYPYGDRSRLTTKLVEQAGFTSACSTRKGAVRSSSDPFALPRIAVGDWDGETFARLLADGLGAGPERKFYEMAGMGSAVAS